MKRILLSSCLALAAMLASAQDYQYLTAAYNSVEQSFALSAVQKITFESDNVVITTSQGTTRLPVSQMQQMYFSATAAALNSLPTQTEGLRVEGGTLTATGQGLLRVYAGSGRLTHVAPVEGETRISLSGLSQGVYVVSLGRQSIKFVK